MKVRIEHDYCSECGRPAAGRLGICDSCLKDQEADARMLKHEGDIEERKIERRLR